MANETPRGNAEGGAQLATLRIEKGQVEGKPHPEGMYRRAPRKYEHAVARRVVEEGQTEEAAEESGGHEDGDLALGVLLEVSKASGNHVSG